MTISLAAGDATNLALRLLKVVEEVLGKQAKARQHRVKQDAARVHAQSLGCRNADCRHKVSLSDIASWRWGTAVQGGGTTRPRLPRRLARGGTDLSASQGQQLFLAGKKRNEWAPVNQRSLPGTLNEGVVVAPLSYRGTWGRMFLPHAFANPSPTLH